MQLFGEANGAGQVHDVHHLRERARKNIVIQKKTFSASFIYYADKHIP